VGKETGGSLDFLSFLIIQAGFGDIELHIAIILIIELVSNIPS
jgi:hypothetical protein